MCTIDYAQQYALNTLALPFTLIALVAATWRINKKRLQQSSRRNLLAMSNVNEADDERANLSIALQENATPTTYSLNKFLCHFDIDI